ncbi:MULTISPECIES: SMP-30/gluconolactonase/LRE family protein [Streptomyces]|uniref:SMP-30/gluconolactonase/LRE family protein n=1 Tax=Streptomyces ramulosus TaxID=47762 RepID=A0ABW1FCL1_9ACTN
MSGPVGVPEAPVAEERSSVATVAGTESKGFSGDDGPAVRAELSRPCAAATDAQGNVYLADTGNDRLRRVDAATKKITTVAGGTLDTRLSRPYGVAVSPQGKIYVADTGNHRVCEVDVAARRITTVAGTGTAGFSGEEGPADQVQLYNPGALATDAAGNLYIADVDNCRVRKLDVGAAYVTTVAGGTKKTELNRPYGVAAHARGDVYIADTLNSRVCKVDASSAAFSVIAGTDSEGFSGDGGPAVRAQLNRPYGVAVDGQGDVYIADTGNHRVRRVAAGTKNITTIAGNGSTHWNGDGTPADHFSLDEPNGVAVDAQGGVHIADTNHHRVRKVTGLSTAAVFTVSPGGPPDVTLTAGCGTGYPGVRLEARTRGPFAPQNVSVTLPPGQGLEFVAEAGARYQLTVRDACTRETHYYGTLSPDGQQLTFSGVDLALSGKGKTSSAWVAVKAPAGTQPADTHLTFDVGGRTSRSTPVHIVVSGRFSVSPGGPPDVTLTAGGPPGYPGVRFRALDDAPVPAKDVSVTLPPGQGLEFVPESGTRYRLTVQDPGGHETFHDATLSDDGRQLRATSVDLALSGKDSVSLAWIAVKAPAGARPDKTSLTFAVDTLTSPSTTVRIT